MITGEIRLYQAMLGKMIEDSLKPPREPLPDYPVDTECQEWIRVRDKRKRMNEEEYWRNQARRDLMHEYAAFLYYVCYNDRIDGLREQLSWMWDDIDKNPKKSKYYLKKFNARAGNVKQGGLKKGQKKRSKKNE